MIDTTTLLLIILSTGFTILVIFVCVALLTIIKILVDVRKITEVVRRETENVGNLVETVSTKTRSFLMHSLVADKIIPAFLGLLSVAIGSRRMHQMFHDDWEDEEENTNNKRK